MTAHLTSSANIAQRVQLDRRLEVVVDGLILWRGAQFAVDAILVSFLSRNGAARRRATNHDGVALDEEEGRHVSRVHWATCGVSGRSWWALRKKTVSAGNLLQRLRRQTTAHEPVLLSKVVGLQQRVQQLQTV